MQFHSHVGCARSVNQCTGVLRNTSCDVTSRPIAQKNKRKLILSDKKQQTFMNGEAAADDG